MLVDCLLMPVGRREGGAESRIYRMISVYSVVVEITTAVDGAGRCDWIVGGGRKARFLTAEGSGKCSQGRTSGWVESY